MVGFVNFKWTCEAPHGTSVSLQLADFTSYDVQNNLDVVFDIKYKNIENSFFLNAFILVRCIICILHCFILCRPWA